MTKIYLALLPMLCLSVFTYGQYTIEGTVRNGPGGDILSGATVTLSLKTGKETIAQTATDTAGRFLLKSSTPGSYRLTISHMGYDNKSLTLLVRKEDKAITLNSAQTTLTKKVIELSEIKVNGKGLYVTRHDTLEFSAKDFKTVDNASMQNLFQKIPGLSVDMEGNIFYQGTRIKDLRIDGRTMGREMDKGNSLKLIQILTANMIDKIQITSEKSLDGKVIHGDNGKIINITIKEELKSKPVGTVAAGYSNNKGYTGAFNGSLFRSDLQIMANLQAENINRTLSLLSSEEMFNGNTGLPGQTRTITGDIRYAGDISKKVKADFTAFKGDHTNTTTEKKDRINILQDSSYRYNSLSDVQNKPEFTAAFMGLDITPSERDNIHFTANVMRTQNNIATSNQYATLSQNGTDTINSGSLKNNNYLDNIAVGVFAIVSHRFKKEGSWLRIETKVDINKSENEQRNYSLNKVPGATADTTHRLMTPVTKSKTFSINPSYEFALSKYMSMNLAYSFKGALLNNDQQTYNITTSKTEELKLDPSLSYNFSNTTLTQQANASVNYRKGKWYWVAGASYNIATSQSKSISATENSYDNTYRYLAPRIMAMYNFAAQKRVSLDVSNTPLNPDARSVIPILALDNPLYVTLGNPDLKPGNINRIHLDYSSLTPSGLTFGILAEMEIQNNAFSTSIYTDPTGKQVSKAINIDGSYNANASINFNKRFNKQGISLDWRTSYHMQNLPSYINLERNIATQYMISNMVTANWLLKKAMEVTLRGTVSYNHNRYEMDVVTHNEYMNYQLQLVNNFYIPGGLNIGTSLAYLNNTGVGEPSYLLNSWIGKTFLKSKALVAKVYAYDMLKDNQSVRIWYNPSYIERSESSTLANYFMAGVTYYFGRGGKKAL